MNINPAAAASVAGTARAAGRGGETDNQATEATRQQSAAESPGGKTSETQVDAGDQTQDRGGDGRQQLDVFEHGEQSEDQTQEKPEPKSGNACQDGAGENLDLEA